MAASSQPILHTKAICDAPIVYTTHEVQTPFEIYPPVLCFDATAGKGIERSSDKSTHSVQRMMGAKRVFVPQR